MKKTIISKIVDCTITIAAFCALYIGSAVLTGNWVKLVMMVLDK